MRLTTTWTNGRVTEGHALVFQYGVDRRTAHLEGKRSLTMTEGASTEETGPFNLGGSMPEPGALRLRGVGTTESGEPEMWLGQRSATASTSRSSLPNAISSSPQPSR